MEKQTEKRRAGKLDEPMFLLVLLLVTVGLIVLFTASYANSIYKFKGNPYYYVVNQGLYAVAGVVAMLFISKIDYRIYAKWMPAIVGIATVFMVITPFIGTEIKGAKRWIQLGPVGFQPSEIAKFAVILFFAVMIAKMGKKKMKTFTWGFCYYMVAIGTVAGLLVLQKHLSAIVIVGVTCAIMMFIGGTRMIYLFGLGGIGFAGGVAYILNNKYAMNRVLVWLDPFIDLKGLGWQAAQSFIAIGSGGVWGLGLGQGRQKHLYLPEPANDFIFSAGAEELGMVGAFLIMIMFAAFIIRGFYVALRAPDKFGTLLVAGIITQIGFQAIFNMCVVTGLVPVTGVSLPFFSHGGTSLLMLLGEMGIVLSVSRYATAQKEE